MPTLARLLAGPHTIAAVVCQPDRPRGRGRRLDAAPVAECARAAGALLLQPERVAAAELEAALRETAPDLGVVVAFGQFLPRRIRLLPALGYCINAHASLLPRHRGAAPIQRAILAGDAETGISVMRVEREMDAGPVLRIWRTPIGASEDAGALGARLAALAADAIADAALRIAAGDVGWEAQDAARATLAPKIEKGDARLDFAEPAEALARRVRALAPKPGAETSLGGEPLRVLAASPETGRTDRPPGAAESSGAGLRVATGAGWLRLLRVQRAGARVLEIAAFLHGHAVPDGTRFGS